MFKKSIVLFFLSLFAIAAFAQETPDQRCDKQVSKKQQDVCYTQLIQDRKEALEEYSETISDSERIPANVKAVVLKDYQSFMRNIPSMCPDKSCVARAMQEQIKDMYKETNAYRDTGKR